MAKAKLSSYIKKIESKYITAREKQGVIYADIDKLTADYKKTNRADYTEQGLLKLDTDYRLEKRKLEKQAQEVTAEFAENATEIIKESDRVFDRKFCYTPEDVDANGITILDRGALSDAEIKELATKYVAAGNNTMYFICVERLKDSTDPDTRAYYNKAQELRHNRQDHNIFNGFIELCIKGLRTDRALANGVHEKLHEQALQDIIKESDNITVEVANPWE